MFLIKIEATLAVKSIAIGSRILCVDQRWISILKEAAMAMWRPGSAIRDAVRFTRIERLEGAILWQDRLDQFIIGIIRKDNTNDRYPNDKGDE